MSNRLNDINNLVNNVKISDNKDAQIIKEIKQKFPTDFEEYSYVVTGTKINRGDIIKYVSLDLKKVSIAGIVIQLNYEDHMLSSSLKNILLLNKNKRIFWQINPKKVYIFRSYKLGKISKKNSEINNDFWRQQINSYLQNYENDLLD